MPARDGDIRVSRYRLEGSRFRRSLGSTRDAPGYVPRKRFGSDCVANVIWIQAVKGQSCRFSNVPLRVVNIIDVCQLH
jgi:hypothetical protein